MFAGDDRINKNGLDYELKTSHQIPVKMCRKFLFMVENIHILNLVGFLLVWVKPQKECRQFSE